MLYPLTFEPIFQPRVWGGRALETVYGKKLPPGETVGESWEISDRPGGVSVIRNGPLAGRDLRWLMAEHREALLGEAPDSHGRFPLLIKLLDAREILSLQVHPPADQAGALGGEPKTEVWYVAHAGPGASVMAGVKPGITRQGFAAMVHAGTVAGALPRLPVQAGDALFLPSGRLHALGAGVVIFEIQQNSDTTYRVFDWNRLGPDGKSRELHLQQALASIDFSDTNPALVSRESRTDGAVVKRLLADCPWFRVEQWRLGDGTVALAGRPRPLVIAAVEGGCAVAHPASGEQVLLAPGGFCLLPACARGASLKGESSGSTCLVAEPG